MKQSQKIRIVIEGEREYPAQDLDRKIAALAGYLSGNASDYFDLQRMTIRVEAATDYEYKPTHRMA